MRNRLVNNVFLFIFPEGTPIFLRQLRCKWFAVESYSVTTWRLIAKASSARESFRLVHCMT